MTVRQTLQDSRDRWRTRQIETGVHFEEADESEFGSEDLDVNIYSVKLEGTMDVEENLESERGEEADVEIEVEVDVGDASCTSTKRWRFGLTRSCVGATWWLWLYWRRIFDPRSWRQRSAWRWW